jgi:hypothetical protein
MYSTLSAKKILFFVAGLITLVIMYSACKKQEAEGMMAEKDLIQSAKSWYTTQIVEKERQVLSEPYSVIPKRDDRRVFARMTKLGRLLNWSEARLTIQDGLEFAIVPVGSSGAWQNTNYKILRAMVFFRDEKGKLSMRIVEMISMKEKDFGSDLYGIAGTAFLNMHLGKATAKPGLEANIIFYDEAYRQLSSHQFIAGSWKNAKLQLKNLRGSPNKQRPVSTVATLSTCNCADYYLIGYWYDTDTGEVVSWEILASYSVCDGGQSTPGYGSAPSPEPAPDDACTDGEALLHELVSSSQESNEISSRDETATGPITRTKIYDWVLRTGPGWNITATLKGTHVKVQHSTDPNLQWAWQNLEFLNISRVGFVAGGNVEPASDYFQWYYGTFISSAEIRYRVDYSMTCAGRPMSSVNRYEKWGQFSANS